MKTICRLLVAVIMLFLLHRTTVYTAALQVVVRVREGPVASDEQLPSTDHLQASMFCG
jgi:hypothetical protein